MTSKAEALCIRDSKLARAITEYIRDTQTEWPFNYSSRVHHFGAMLHDIGLMPSHATKDERFEMASSTSLARPRQCRGRSHR